MPQAKHPLVNRSAKTQRVFATIEEPVPSVKVDFYGPIAGVYDAFCQRAEKWSNRTLQQQHEWSG